MQPERVVQRRNSWKGDKNSPACAGGEKEETSSSVRSVIRVGRAAPAGPVLACSVCIASAAAKASVSALFH